MTPSADEIERTFPAIASIEDEALRRGVVEAWIRALADTGWTLEEIPWFPPIQERLGLPDETLVEHVNLVVEGALALAELLVDRRGTDLSLDTVLAGALVHDVSKPYEFDSAGSTRVHDLLGHPHYGVYPVARAGLPPEVVHVVLSHSYRTAVEPATIEAAVVRRADEVAAAAIRWEARSDLRDA